VDFQWNYNEKMRMTGQKRGQNSPFTFSGILYILKSKVFYERLSEVLKLQTIKDDENEV